MAAKTVVASVLYLTALVLLILLFLSGFGTKYGLWDFRTGLSILRWTLMLAVGLGLISFGAVFFVLGGAMMNLFKVLFACWVFTAMGLWGLALGRTAKSLPMIHDISTDTVHPPQFEAVLPLRKHALNSLDYGGAEIAELQHKAYPDIEPKILRLAPDEAFAKALAVANEMGWKIVASDKAAGHIEAIDTTYWFGFKDDIVVRIELYGLSSRIDVRSVSRVGKSDIGTNAKRIRAYLARL